MITNRRLAEIILPTVRELLRGDARVMELTLESLFLSESFPSTITREDLADPEALAKKLEKITGAQ